MKSGATAKNATPAAKTEQLRDDDGGEANAAQTPPHGRLAEEAGGPEEEHDQQDGERDRQLELRRVRHVAPVVAEQR